MSCNFSISQPTDALFWKFSRINKWFSKLAGHTRHDPLTRCQVKVASDLSYLSVSMVTDFVVVTETTKTYTEVMQLTIIGTTEVEDTELH